MDKGRQENYQRAGTHNEGTVRDRLFIELAFELSLS